MHLWQRLVKVCSLLVITLVALQVSDPCNNMVLALELTISNLVLSEIDYILVFNMLKVVFAFQILAFVSIHSAKVDMTC